MSFQQGFSGALGGGLAGGSIGGPAGAIIGGGLGLLGGLFGGSGLSKEQEEAQRRLLALGSQGFDPRMAAGSDVRSQQMDQLGRLTALAEGRGPSFASQQMQQGLRMGQASNQAAAGSAIGRGVGPGAALRNASSMNSSMAQNTIGQTGMARSMEQLGALSQLTGAQAGVRGADESLNMFNAGQYNDTQQRNRLLQLQALSQLYGKQLPAGFGDQLLAGGANMYSLLGSRRGQRGDGLPPVQIAGLPDYTG